MKNSYYILLLTFLLASSQTTSAYWYTELDSLTPVAITPDTNDVWNCALPYPDGQTLVILYKGYIGQTYQIIDRFGQLKYDLPQPLTPGYIAGGGGGIASLFSDNQSGAVIGWKHYNRGLIAQRLDSLGNLMWGDEGVLAFPDAPNNWACCSDGEGGMLFTYAAEVQLDEHELYIQKILPDGSLPWGAYGIPSGTLTIGNSPELTMCSDGAGGAYACWEDGRNPPWGSLYAQHFNADGQGLWPGDLFIMNGQPLTHDLFADGYGGVLMFIGGLTWNDVYRYDANGMQIWLQNNVSYVGYMFPGEPDFWYTGHNWYNDVYAQRIDVDGNLYWPEPYGALMYHRSDWGLNYPNGFMYWDGYFAGIFPMSPPGSLDDYIFIQALDEQGNCVILPDAALIYVAYDDESLRPGESLNVIPTNDGLTAVVDIYSNSPNESDKIYAKHIFWDGSLGGPIPLEVTLTPETSPIHIPPTGGSFQYDIAIADTTPVGGSFDAWIEATLPNGSTLEILSREEISITPGETINRLDVVQNVPANAPSGNYTYTLIIGQHDCQYAWVQDSFSFSKLSQWDYPVYDGGQDSLAFVGARHASPLHGDSWLLTGFFDELSDEMQHPTASGGAPSAPSTLDVSISPNPFNPTTTISFDLPVASFVELTVYNITGRNVGAQAFVGARHASPLHGGQYQPGNYTITFDGSGLPSGIYFVRLEAERISSVKKMVLLK